ncbi:MAG TPA: TetR/AcrR family transcriptional regulator [Acidobacteriaceae bacterium]|nr:TetR/AcrR family transcriptional regulator [Acidobacteriaceae bacterium]
MPKVSQEYLAARRSEILDAAIVCFSRDGFHRTTMKDIVRESRLSPGAIYNYFQSKEEIIEAIAARRQETERHLMREAIDEGPATEVLRQVRDAFLYELENTKERLRRRVSVQLWAEAQRSPEVRKIVRRSFEEPRKLLSGVLLEAQRQGAIAKWADVDALASFVIAAFHGLVLQREWDSHFSVEPHKRLLDLLLKAVAAEHEPAMAE